MKKFAVFVLLQSLMLACLTPRYSLAFEQAQTPEIKALLAEIVEIHVPSQENEARLLDLFKHEDLGVSTSAKIRIAELYWKSGRFELAKAILEELSKSYDIYPPKYKIESLLTWASFELRRNNYIEVENYTRRAIEVAESSHQELLGNTYFFLGNALKFQKKIIQAKQAYDLSLAEFQKRGDGKGALLVLNSLGVMYKDSGDLVNGIKYLLQAREEVEVHGSRGYKASVNYNLGDVFLISDEPNKAIEYYKKALALDLELGDLGNLAHDYRGIASAYLKLEQYTQALDYNQQAVLQLLKIKAPQELSRTYLQQSRIFNKLEDSDNRLKSLLLAEKSAQQSGSQYQLMSVGIDKAKYQLDQEIFELARDELLAAQKVATELSLNSNLMEINKLLATTYQRLNEHENAYRYLIASYELQDELNSEDRREKSERYKRDVNLLEEQLKVSELEKTEAEQTQALKEQEIVKQRMMILMVAAAVVFIALTILLVQRRKLANLRADLFEEALEQKQKLFADVSHELRTPLTALKLQIQALQFDLVSNVEDSYEKLANKVNEINRLIADIYQLAQADTNSLVLNKNEVGLASLFDGWQGDWQNTVEGSGFAWQCQLNLGDSVKSLDTERIKQVIDNLLSNAIVYTDKPGTILLDAHMESEQLVVSVEDTPPTVCEDKLEMIFNRLYRVESSRSRQTGGSGLGLAICEGLIKVHGGTIKAEQSKLGGLKVTFRI